MLIYDAIIKDHRELIPLVERLISSADASASERKNLIRKIRDELIPHARAEEAVFYNSLRGIEETKNLIIHSYAEHMEAEALLRSLEIRDPLDSSWRKTARKFKEDLEHHMQDEENRVIPAAQKVLTVAEAEMMGRAFEQMKPQVRESGVLATTIEILVSLMPDRFAEPLRSFFHRS